MKLMHLSIFSCLSLLACGPTPSSLDARVARPEGGWSDGSTGDRPGTDARSRDAQQRDASTVDHQTSDQGLLDTGLDTSFSDLVQPDQTSLDSATFDSALADAGAHEVYLFYGPYVATNMPRILLDATNSGSTTTTVPIEVPASLNVDFVDVHIEIAHQDSRDLLVDLLPPTGSSTRLYDGVSCTTNCNANVVVGLRADVYNNTAGFWVLRVTDRAITHTGTVLSFTISFVP